MKHKIASKLVILFVLLALIFPQGAQAREEIPPQQVEETSPLQEALKAQFAERQAAGEPVPSVTYEYEVAQSARMPYSAASAPNESPTIVATTIVAYDNPQEAGYEAWPSLDMEGGQTNFDELYYNQMESLVPGFWELYEFGQEPRRMTYVETIQLTAPPPSQASKLRQAPGHLPTEDILMGFTFAGPNLDYTLNSSFETCVPNPFYPFTGPEEFCGTVYNFEAGFKLNVALGLRLPAQVTLYGPNQMDLGSAYSISASLTPFDWTQEQYLNYNVVGEDGKEFVLSVIFFLGVKVEIAGVDLCQALSAGAYSCYAEEGMDQSADFATPLGSGTSFPIPPGKLEIAQWGLGTLFDNGKKDGTNVEISEDEYNILDELFNAAVGVSLTPEISSSDISAHWEAVGGNYCGSGTVHFTASGTPVTVGPANACAGGSSNEATIRLSDFRYNFNQFALKFGAYLDINVIGFEVPLGFDFFSVDLSQWTAGIGLYLGQHYQCAWQDITNPFVCGSQGPDNVVELTMGMSLSASSHDFGAQQVGTTSDAFNFTITNTGNDVLRIGTLSSAAPFAISVNNCNNTIIDPNTTCSFSVTFHPPSMGTGVGAVSISDNAPGGPHSIALSGNGVDIVPPTLFLPANIIVPQTLPGGAMVIYTATAVDLVAPPAPLVTCDPASGGIFPVGVTTVNCSAMDQVGNVATGSFTVTVRAGRNLLGYPGFSTTSSFPYPWNAFGVRLPYTSALDDSLFNSAPFSVKLTSDTQNTYKAVFQKVRRSGLAGDKFSFGLSNRALNVPRIGGLFQVEVVFYDLWNKVLGTSVLKLTPGNHGFQLVSGVATAPANYSHMLFRFVFQKAGGQAWFDDAFLIQIP